MILKVLTNNANINTVNMFSNDTCININEYMYVHTRTHVVITVIYFFPYWEYLPRKA